MMRHRFVFPGTKIIFTLCIFAVLAAAIWTRVPKWMGDFDQSFYLTIAYDIDRHGVFSNGMFDDVNSTVGVPAPGMFIGPLYPWLALAMTKIDPRFGKAVTCSVEANHGTRDRAECETYARPMNLLHALLLTIGVLGIARSAELIFPGGTTFWLAGALATWALAVDAELFSYVMTESLTFSLYSLTMWAMVVAWTTQRWRNFALAGVLLGLLCLTRTAYMILAPVMIVLIIVQARFFGGGKIWQSVFAFAFFFSVMVVPWAVRNYVSVGKFAMTEEYGSAALIERFAFNQITLKEFVLAFPYCLPAVGPSLVNCAFAKEAMDRFEWNKPGSFFETGRATRSALVATYQRLDPMIGELIREEMSENWWRHILVSIPLAWCGLWLGGWLAFLLAPAFVWAGIAAVRQSRPLFLFYAAPGLVMLALHAGVANHYTRYNLILICAYAAGVAWLMARSAWFARARLRWQASGPAP